VTQPPLPLLPALEEAARGGTEITEMLVVSCPAPGHGKGGKGRDKKGRTIAKVYFFGQSCWWRALAPNDPPSEWITENPSSAAFPTQWHRHGNGLRDMIIDLKNGRSDVTAFCPEHDEQTFTLIKVANQTLTAARLGWTSVAYKHT